MFYISLSVQIGYIRECGESSLVKLWIFFVNYIYILFLEKWSKPSISFQWLQIVKYYVRLLYKNGLSLWKVWSYSHVLQAIFCVLAIFGTPDQGQTFIKHDVGAHLQVSQRFLYIKLSSTLFIVLGTGFRFKSFQIWIPGYKPNIQS